jgi:hypothetical protein
MKQSLITFLSLIATLLTMNAWADLPNLKLSVTLVNESHEVLIYTGFTNANPENIFLVSPKIVMPQEKVTITALSNDYNFADLSGDIHFQDNLGKDHSYHLTDPQQMHYAQSNFLLGDAKSLARLVNIHPQPLNLTYGDSLM